MAVRRIKLVKEAKDGLVALRKQLESNLDSAEARLIDTKGAISDIETEIGDLNEALAELNVLETNLQWVTGQMD